MNDRSIAASSRSHHRRRRAHTSRAPIVACHTHQLRKLVRPKPDQPDRLLRPCVPRTKLWLLFVLCVQRAVQEPFDRRAWAYAMLYVNLYGPQLLYSVRKFGQVFLTRTVHGMYRHCIKLLRLISKQLANFTVAVTTKTNTQNNYYVFLS